MRRIAGIVLAGAMAAVFLPSTAAASCAAAPPMKQALEDAPAIVVGTVTEVRYEARWATVSVGEVWKGDSIPSTVEVRSGVGRPNVMSTVDRTYEVGQSYLFVPYERDDDVLRDNACTRTMRFTERAARFRPETIAAHVIPGPPGANAEPSPTDGDPSPAPGPERAADDARARSTWPWLIVGGLALVLTLGAELLRRRAARRP